MKTIQDFFKIAMDRDIGKLWKQPKENMNLVQINLGDEPQGLFKALPNEVLNVGWGGFFGVNLEHDSLPFNDDAVSTIYAFHVLEHIQNLDHLMAECGRVLAPNGVMNICVPYYKSNMAFQDPDHKRWFTEDTWDHYFSNAYYKPYGDQLNFKVHFNLIIGIVERNLALLTQLIKVD